MKKSKIKKVGLWLRVNNTNQPEDMFKKWESAAEAFAHNKNMKIVARYRVQHSDLPILKHPQTKRMINHIKTGKIQALIIPKISMLARNLRDFLCINKILETYNADLISIEEYFDTSAANGLFLFHLFKIVAEFKRELCEEKEKILS
jgi:site-specific DNA recombinase